MSFQENEEYLNTVEVRPVRVAGSLSCGVPKQEVPPLSRPDIPRLNLTRITGPVSAEDLMYSPLSSGEIYIYIYIYKSRGPLNIENMTLGIKETIGNNFMLRNMYTPLYFMDEKQYKL